MKFVMEKGVYTIFVSFHYDSFHYNERINALSTTQLKQKDISNILRPSPGISLISSFSLPPAETPVMNFVFITPVFLYILSHIHAS